MSAAIDGPPPATLAELFLGLGAVRRLVRDGLGCECPEEVFQDVVVGCPAVFGGGAAACELEVLVGRRLLIGVVRVEALPADPAQRQLAVRALLEQGRATRDRRRLNRFRLVLVGELPEESLVALRSAALGLDDRVHVHSLALPELRALVLPT